MNTRLNVKPIKGKYAFYFDYHFVLDHPCLKEKAKNTIQTILRQGCYFAIVTFGGTETEINNFLEKLKLTEGERSKVLVKYAQSSGPSGSKRKKRAVWELAESTFSDAEHHIFYDDMRRFCNQVNELTTDFEACSRTLTIYQVKGSDLTGVHLDHAIKLALAFKPALELKSGEESKLSLSHASGLVEMGLAESASTAGPSRVASVGASDLSSSSSIIGQLSSLIETSGGAEKPPGEVKCQLFTMQEHTLHQPSFDSVEGTPSPSVSLSSAAFLSGAPTDKSSALLTKNTDVSLSTSSFTKFGLAAGEPVPKTGVTDTENAGSTFEPVSSGLLLPPLSYPKS
jgi:hypothetical protein